MSNHPAHWSLKSAAPQMGVPVRPGARGPASQFLADQPLNPEKRTSDVTHDHSRVTARPAIVPLGASLPTELAPEL
jgi:hypothetical protein